MARCVKSSRLVYRGACPKRVVRNQGRIQPKVGRYKYTSLKDFRQISVTFFTQNTVETVVYRYMRDKKNYHLDIFLKVLTELIQILLTFVFSGCRGTSLSYEHENHRFHKELKRDKTCNLQIGALELALKSIVLGRAHRLHYQEIHCIPTTLIPSDLALRH